MNLKDGILRSRFKIKNSSHRSKILEIISAPNAEQQVVFPVLRDFSLCCGTFTSISCALRRMHLP